MEGRYPTNEIVNGGIATIDVPGSAPANHITRHVGLHGIVIDKGAPAQRIAFCPHVVIRMFVPRGGGWRRQQQGQSQGHGEVIVYASRNVVTQHRPVPVRVSDLGGAVTIPIEDAAKGRETVLYWGVQEDG